MGNDDYAEENESKSIPEVTVEGAPPEFLEDPEMLRIYMSFKDGFDAATSGLPSEFVFGFDGDVETMKAVYEAGYAYGSGETPSQPPEQLGNWFHGREITGPLGGKPYRDEFSPATRAILEWLGQHEKDPHIELPQYKTDTTEPPPIVSGPGD